MLFWWGCKSFHFLIYNFNPNSSPTIPYSDLFLFTNASFHFLIYNINVTFYATLTYFNPLQFNTAYFHFFVYNLNINFSPELIHSGIFLLTTACFTPMWHVSIKIWIGGVTCCSDCSGLFKNWFFWRRLRCTLLSFVCGIFLSVQFFNFCCTLIPQIDISRSHLSKDIFHVNIIHPDGWTFVSWN